MSNSRQKNCEFPQNFRTGKLGGITIFYTVVLTNLLCLPTFEATRQSSQEQSYQLNLLHLQDFNRTKNFGNVSFFVTCSLFLCYIKTIKIKTT